MWAARLIEAFGQKSHFIAPLHRNAYAQIALAQAPNTLL